MKLRLWIKGMAMWFLAGAASAFAQAYTNEPMPNGGRVNVGLYGGTAEASKSRTNDWLFAMTYNDGGTLWQTGRIEWVGGNLGTGATVNLQYSTNNGVVWSNIATDVAATNETYTWVPDFDYPAVRWRVVNSTNSAVASTNARVFSVRAATNATYTFYVNDGSQVGDVYCTAVGASANDGAGPNRPKRSLREILADYQLRGGDTVYVDTGIYVTNATTAFTIFDRGSVGMPLCILGSSSGSVLRSSGAGVDVLEVSGSGNMEIDNLCLTGGRYGVFLNGASNVAFRNMQSSNNTWGVVFAGTTRGIDFDRCVITANTNGGISANSASMQSNWWNRGVIWNNPVAITAFSNALTVSNSVLGGGATLLGNHTVVGDFNVVGPPAVPGAGFATFSDLQNAGQGWSRSLRADPLFANAAAGDFHLKSFTGRYNPSTGLFDTNDVHSPAIDFGDPVASVGDEPIPNGSRLNAGLYGGTVEASMSKTNGWVQLLSHNDGGTMNVQAGSWVRWEAGGYAPGATISIWISRDAGVSWELLVGGIAATNGNYFYQNPVADDSSSIYGRLRVLLDDAVPEAFSQSPTNFTFRNGTFSFYINDSSLAGDVYCTAGGNDNNLGTSAGAPMMNLHKLFEKYTILSPGDRVYIDTGLHTATNAVILTSAFSGSATNPVVFIGSTNRAAGGSVFRYGNVRFDIRPGASNLVIRDVAMTNVAIGVSLDGVVNVKLDGVEVRSAGSRAFQVQGNSRDVELVRCVAHGGPLGVELQQATNVVIRQGVFWENTTAGVQASGVTGCVLENSILASTRIGASLLSISGTGLASDYNGLHAGPDTFVGAFGGSPTHNVRAWQRVSGGQDLHSIPGDPQIASPEGMDYHLKTEQTLGRLLSNGQRTSDRTSSPLLDAGNPASTSWTNEPSPNGGRVNIGRWGGTVEASMAPTVPWIRTVSFGDAGGVSNETIQLLWTAGGFSNQTAKVEVSLDGGQTWGTTVTNGVKITNGVAVWNVSGLPNTPAGAWRVVCLQQTNLTARSSQFFSIRNGALDIYVAPVDVFEPVYVSAAGTTNNWMATTNAPLSSLRMAFERFDLEPGDRIWVDTGKLIESFPIQIGMKNSGSVAEPIRIIGNTNKPYNGTSLSLYNRSANVVDLLRAGGIRMESLSITNGLIGVNAGYSGGVSLERVRVEGMSQNGVLANTTPVSVMRSILDQANVESTGSVVTVQHSLIRNGYLGNIVLNGGTVNVRNSVLEAIGYSGSIYYYRTETGTMISDYNNIRATEGANVAGGMSRESDRYLIDWQIRTAFANDKNSFGYEPHFANRESYDFHLKSEYGRFDPEVAAYVTNDVVTSRLIDLGDPATAWSNEPSPNGGRVNVGLFGGTNQASKSPTQGSLVPLTMSDGGTIRGEAKLYWSWNGLLGNVIVRVQFSSDGGSNWMDIATNVYADVGTSGLTWSTTNFPSTAMGVWRVMTTNEPPIVGQTENLFSLKNEPLQFYINDKNVGGDVYCTAPGASSNTGSSSNSPVDSFSRLFVLHQVDHGDTIYVDTGKYTNSSVGISSRNPLGESRFVIQGSTNEAAGGTIITNSGGFSVMNLSNIKNVDLRDLTLHGGNAGLQLSSASSNRLFRIRSVYARGAAFSLSAGSDQNQFVQCAALHFMNTGLAMEASGQATAPATNSWTGGVIASIPADAKGNVVATGNLVSATSGRLNISNSVLMANGPLDTIFTTAKGVIQSDYNVYHREKEGVAFAQSSFKAPYGRLSEKIDHLNTWVDWNGTDTNSMEIEPKFADFSIFDLHPRSMAGRHSPQFGTFLVDVDNSPLMDAANPTTHWSEETDPNGSRANVGIYGGTQFASRTPSNDVFVLLTLNQGGLVRGNHTLRWNARAGATNVGQLVNIQVSTNSGVNWQTLVSGVEASLGQHTWDTAAFPSRATMRWRVSSQSEMTWQATSERDFTIHNSPIPYYVNDASTSNDLYCSAIGSTNHTGLTPASPLPSLGEVLSRYDLEAGDTVYVDTGVYSGNGQTELGYLDGGTAASPVTIQGSTRYPGSVFTGNGLALKELVGVKIRHVRFQLTSAYTAAEIENAQDITLEFVDMVGCGDGITIEGSSNVFLRNFSVVGAMTNGVRSTKSFNTRLEYGTIWSNGLAQISAEMASNEFVVVSNCVMGAFGLRKPIYQLSGSNNLVANFNNLYLENGALAALRTESGFLREYNSVGRWSTVSGMDRNSLSHFPFFANSGAGDVHLKSSAGRFDPAIVGYVTDDSAAENSPMVDAGNPSAPFGTEPMPNGGRVNMGRYGNTAEASKTPTNGTLTLISFNDGGQVSGTNVVLRWLARGGVTNGTVSIWYSSNGGSNWVNLASGIAAGVGSWTWNSTAAIPTVQGQIRIVGSDGSEAINRNFFSLRNQPFKFYINDNSTSNDVFCTAVGNNLNSGLTNSAPMADLNALLAKYGLAGGDIVYIDTGTYRPLIPWRIGQSASAGWLGDPPVVFQGSTNAFPSGTVLNREYNSGGLDIEYAVGVELRNITVFKTQGTAVNMKDSVGISAEWVTVEAGDTAFQLSGGNQLSMTHCVVYDCNRGVVVGAAGQNVGTPVKPVIENNVFWLMSETCIQASANQPVIRNNILSIMPNKYVYEISTTNSVDSDYNSIWLGNGGRMFRRTLPRELSPIPIIYETVGKWAAVSGQDLHSYDGDPLLANPELRDFRLKSQAGRWVPEMGGWTNDSISSPLIDAGDPVTAWSNEPSPNGGRINMGAFGGSTTASQSPTNAALYLLSLNRGGVASGQVALNWRAAGRATGHTVRVSMSTDGGASWTPIASGLPAKLGGILWNSYSLNSSPVSRWKVESEQQAGLMAVSELPFVLHNEPIRYYVNDDSGEGDVWCTAVGSSGHTGLSPVSPKRWAQEIVDAYDLEPGDLVVVDTGYYYVDSPTVFGELDAGATSEDASQQITLQGSTNAAYGGSKFVASDPMLTPFVISNSYGIRLKNFDISGALNGVWVQNSIYVEGDWLSQRGGSNGVLATASSNVVLQHCSFVDNYESGVQFSHPGTLSIDSSVLWSNKYALRLDQGRATVQNSIMGMMTPESCGFFYRSDRQETSLSANYNNLWVAGIDAAVAKEVSGTITSAFYSVARWNTARLNDKHSLAQEPLLADTAKGDFHLKSTRGRWQNGLNAGWVQDNQNSPLLDMGNSNSLAWLMEPEPNGRRLNIGMYGGTPEASKTPVEGWLTMLSLYDGGFGSGIVDLKWESGGAASNYTVCIEFSSDNGISWTNIVCNWPASSGGYAWDSTLFGASALGRWRMYCLEDSGITAISAKPFVLRNGGVIKYYVNDGNTNDSLYTTAPGDDDNNGLTPSTPKASLQSILDTYELEPEDVVYVDAGTYLAGAPPIQFNQRDSGFSNLYITVQGSANPLAPTVFMGTSFGVQGVFSLNYAYNWKFRDFTIRNGGIGVVASESHNIEFENVRIENNRNAGLSLNKSDQIRLVRSVLWKNASPTGGVAVVLSSGGAVELENCVAWGHFTAVMIENGLATVSNSVLDASGVNGRIYGLTINSGPDSFCGDYNCYVRKNGAIISEKPQTLGGSDFYNTLPAWSAVTFSDQHSMTLNPEFADEVSGDFHPKSTQGRYKDGIWMVDPVLSPLIDAGSPTISCTNEPSPNGGILNIGVYGNSKQASMTQTNPPWLKVVSYNDSGDVISGNALLYWLHGGMPSNSLVRLDYSSDQITWKVIATNIPAGSRQYLWESSTLPLTVALNWRVVLQADEGVQDISDNPVAIKTGNFDYYVNDASTVGDFWCTGPGLPWSDEVTRGTNRSTPLNNLKTLLDKLPVSGGDRIYVDTGVFSVSSTNPILFNDRNMGSQTMPLSIYGSTNVLAGGTLFQGNGTASGIRIQNTRHIELNDIRITGAQNAISIDNVDTVRMRGLELFNNLSNAVSVSGSGGIDVRNGLFWNNGQFGYLSGGQKGAEAIQNSTLWGNRAGGVSIGTGNLDIQNSILGVTNATLLMTEAGTSTIGGNYNLFSLVPGAMLGSNSFDKVGYANLRQWQNSGRDANSFVGDPMFVDSTNGNFHLQSKAGWWNNGTFSTSTVTSWAIDAGNPASTNFASEPSPNGGRINLGSYGGTRFASKTDSAAGLFVLSLRDGGTAQELQYLHWLFRGMSATNMVRVEYSPDGGSSWVTQGIVQAVASPYEWYSSDPPTPEALWRVVLVANTNLSDTTPDLFIHRTRPLVYYVNDNSLAGDIYTKAVGSVTNRGYVSNSPLHSVQAVLERYPLSGGDEVRVDTGNYIFSEPVFISGLQSGEAGNPSKLIGSTNIFAGGTRIMPASGMSDPAYILYQAQNVDVSWMHLVGFTNAFSIQREVTACRFQNMDIQGSTGPGFTFAQANGNQLDRVVLREGRTTAIQAGQSKFTILNSVIWSNQGSALNLGNGVEAEITNSVIEVSGAGRYAYFSSTTTVIRADYNNLYIRDGGQIASINGTEYPRMPQWNRFSLQDRFSLSSDPLFANPTNGDFHLRSVAGRYQYGAGWVLDVINTNLPNFSPLIDMGSPTTWSNEPAPNGGRRNMGLYGDTWQASKSNTNRWLQAITASSGGLAFGGFPLTWGYGGDIGTNEVVRLQYSYEDGTTENWITIIDTTVGSRQYYWQSDQLLAGLEKWPTSPAARWRLMLLGNTNIVDMTDVFFGLRNSPFRFFVNDHVLDGDVYTTRPGNDANMGFYPAAPKRNLQTLLDAIDLEPTDQVYIDTGDYYMVDTNAPIRWELKNSGGQGQSVWLRGSTNENGTWFIATNRFSTDAFFYMNASNVDIRNIYFVGESVALAGNQLTAQFLTVSNGGLKVSGNYSTFKDVQVTGGDVTLQGNYSSFTNMTVNRGNVSLSGINSSIGLMKQRFGTMALVGTNVTLVNSSVYATNNLGVAVDVNSSSGGSISNCTIVSSRGTALRKQGVGTLRAQHNILVAAGSDANSVISWENGNLISDWNDLVARGSAWLGSRNGRWERLAYWRTASGQDGNSVSIEPLFADEVGGDFHLQSVTGRWIEATSNWVSDASHSPVIDLGNPALGAGNELYPNGSRRNLGAYGGTTQASKSKPGMWLTALTANDGGVLKGPSVVLRWAAPFSGQFDSFRLQYSPDGGASWTNIATDIGTASGIGTYLWNSTGFIDSFNAMWQVLALDGSGVQDTIDTSFSLRNQPKNFYVNDLTPEEDIYTTEPGNDANDGLTPATPKRTLQTILNTYDLEGGDVVYVDAGAYSSTSDVRMIWSRSGSTNAPLVIQGNTNGAFTLFTRTGNTNFPAMGLDVKGSDVTLRHLAIQGIDRGIYLESNRNVKVEGAHLLNTGTGISVLGARETEIRNTAFWKNLYGIQLSNTSTSVLESLTFALSGLAGIQLSNTEVDSLQNNLFIPLEGAYAYSIGASTSLLLNATMDYNLYDFGRTNSGFFDGATSDLRRWHLGMNKDFRSAITNAFLADVEVTGDLHPQSEFGRWTPTGWVVDAVTSWAVDHGNPTNDYSREPSRNGNRMNIGMYGNTPQASQGSATTNYEIRTLNEGQIIQSTDQTWPMIWSTHLVHSNEWVLVQFSNDGGDTWLTLTNVNAYQEYYIWQAQPQFQTVNGRWRVIGVNDPSLWAQNVTNFTVKYRDLAIVSSPRPTSGLMRFEWEGGVGGLRYRIEYSDDFGQTWNTWSEKYNGPAFINKSNFVIPAGETKLSYTFEDRTSYLRRTRMYRIWQVP